MGVLKCLGVRVQRSPSHKSTTISFHHYRVPLQASHVINQPVSASLGNTEGAVESPMPAKGPLPQKGTSLRQLFQEAFIAFGDKSMNEVNFKDTLGCQKLY